jgi:hypothetical protein
MGIKLSAGTIYDADNPQHRAELAASLTKRLGEAGFALSQDRNRDPGRTYGGGFKGREAVYVFKHRKDPGLEVQVFTSVVGSGEVRSKGADAIRVCLVYKNKAKQQNPEAEEAKQYDLGSECRVYRTGDIDAIVERTVQRAREAYMKANLVERCKDCNAPLAKSKAGKMFCSEVCWTKKPGYKAPVKADAAKSTALSQDEVRALAKTILKNDAWVEKTLSTMFKPSSWKFVEKWSEKAWREFIEKNSKNYMDMLRNKATAAMADTYLLLAAVTQSVQHGYPIRAAEALLTKVVADAGIPNMTAVPAAVLSNEELEAVNEMLMAAGFDGAQHFLSLGDAMVHLQTLMGGMGMEVDDPMTAEGFDSESGQATVRIARSNASDPTAPVPIDNANVQLQWTVLGPDSYEVVAHAVNTAP